MCCCNQRTGRVCIEVHDGTGGGTRERGLMRALARFHPSLPACLRPLHPFPFSIHVPPSLAASPSLVTLSSSGQPRAWAVRAAGWTTTSLSSGLWPSQVGGEQAGGIGGVGGDQPLCAGRTRCAGIAVMLQQALWDEWGLPALLSLCEAHPTPAAFLLFHPRHILASRPSVAPSHINAAACLLPACRAHRPLQAIRWRSRAAG